MARDPYLVLKIPPYGRMRMYFRADEPDLLKLVKSDWPVLWPAVRAALQERCASYDRGEMLKLPRWISWAGRLEPDAWKYDEADYAFGIQMNGEWPIWDFFIKGTDIAHHQPVF
jgi:hypothetical protein